MKCPKCQTENPEGKKFCRECGAKLAVACPQCSSEIFPGDKFCGECGHNLALPSESTSPKELSFDEKLDKIQRYLPEGLTEKILSQRDKIEGERRQVTIMFCDMKGFTPLTEMLGPEETFSLIDQVYEILIHKVHDYEGTVNELRGDGILALFGAPIALEDAPQRAIRSALAIHREMARFNEKIKGIYSIPPILLRIGINTGPVVVGAVGNNLRVQFTAAGDTINMASRMEGLAEPGTTYVTEDTFKLTEGFFRFEALGKKEVKGKNEPLSVYRVIAPRTSRTRFDVSSERGLTTFVGRERELELLLDAFERAKAGRGQAISVVSEAGVGKSRLLYEFRKAVTNEDVTFLEGKCLSYSRSVAYHPVIDIFKANFDVMENDGDEEIREKVDSGLKTLGLDNVSTFPYILELLSVEDSGIDTIPISPEARKDRIMEALKQIVLKGSEIRALILAYEDLHWADKSSEDVLKYILESIPAARVLLLFTYRPEFVHSWGGKSFHSQITLNKLSNRESLTMIYHLLGTQAVESHLEELILEKAEGVPFFIEEFIRSLKDLKIIDIKDGKYALAKDIRELTIPSTIQDVIMARIDALPESAKEVLQIGSVIEREFRYELMKSVAGLPEQELLSQLSVLRDSELLYERRVYPGTTYIFKHALTREVVYESMLSHRKRRLHEQVANAIIELFKDRVEEYYGVLAEHFIASEIYEKGAEYSNLAGKKARKAALFLDAIEHAKKRLRCLQKFFPTDETHHKIIDTRTFLASCYLSLNRFFEAKQAVNPIFDLAVQLDYKRRLPQIYTIMGTSCYWVDEDFPLAFEYLARALTLSEKTGNFGSQWFSNYFLGTTLSGSCEFERALGYFKKALDMSVSARNLTTESFTKGAMTAFNYNYQGKIDLAYQTSSEALDLAEQTGDIYVEGMAYTSHGIPCYHKGLFDKAESCLLKGLELCQKTTQVAWAAWASFWLAELHVDRGDYESAENYYRKAISIFTEHGKVFASWVRMFEVCIERSKVLKGQRNVDLNKLLSCYDGIKMKILEGFMARYIGEVLLKMGGGYLSEAEGWIEKAMEADKRNGAIWLLGCDCELYAEFLRHKEDLIGVRENLDKALVTFKECGAEGHLKRVEGKLAALH